MTEVYQKKLFLVHHSISYFTACINLLLILVINLPITAYAIAYCSLRDPVVAINKLFPNATHHKTIVKTIGKEARDAIAKDLGFTLHFNELGRHTLYAIYQNKTVLGYIHARTEQSSWGLVEFAWGLNLDLSVNEFFIQRCRSPLCNKHFSNTNNQKLRGKSLSEIKLALNISFQQQTETMTELDKLSHSLLQSAAKTISVTNWVWGEEVIQNLYASMLQKHYPNINTKIQQAYLTELEEKKLEKNDSILISDSVTTFHVFHQDKPIAYLVNASWQQGQHFGQFTWLFDQSAKIQSVKPIYEWNNQEIQEAFNATVGRTVFSSEQCHNAAELVANELYQYAKRAVLLNK